MNNRYKIGDKVKMTRSAAEWILEHPECWQVPSTGELVGYDACAIDSMLTLLGEPPIGTITALGFEQGTYHVKYSREHISVYEADRDFYPASKVELEVDIGMKAVKRLQKLSKLSGVGQNDVLAVLLAQAIMKEEPLGLNAFVNLKSNR